MNTLQDTLIQQLQQGTEAQRQRAAYQLAQTRQSGSLPALLEALNHETSRHVLWVIIAALGVVGDMRIAPLLLRILNDSELPHHLRYQASRSLEAVSGQRNRTLPDVWSEASELEVLVPAEESTIGVPIADLMLPAVVLVDVTLEDLREETIEPDEAPPDTGIEAPVTPERPTIRVTIQQVVVETVGRLTQLLPTRRNGQIERRLDQYLTTIPDVAQHYLPSVRRSSLLPNWVLDELNQAISHAPGDTRSALERLIVSTASMDMAERESVERMFTGILNRDDLPLSQAQRQRLFDTIIAEILGFGPLEALLADESISEIMINGPRNIFVERRGNISRAAVSFEDDDHLIRILQRMLAVVGMRIEEDQPLITARLPDQSRITIVMPPISVSGPTAILRKASKHLLRIEDLIRFGSLNLEAAEFLRACVIARMNILVSGGTGSGKTTLMNVLANFIPDYERILTIEHTSGLSLAKEHVITFETQQLAASQQIAYAELVAAAEALRPDRILFGEPREGRDAFAVIQAMNSGFDGAMFTLHANSVTDAVARLEILFRLANVSLTERAIRELIAAALDVVVHQQRMRDGSRRVTSIVEVKGISGDHIDMTHVFEFEQTGIESGRIIGLLRPTGIRPQLIDRIEDSGIHLPPSVFGIGKRR